MHVRAKGVAPALPRGRGTRFLRRSLLLGGCLHQRGRGGFVGREQRGQLRVLDDHRAAEGFLYLKFRDSLTEMDSRFHGNDVVSARHVAFTLAVIPAKAGIHRLIQGILNPET